MKMVLGKERMVLWTQKGTYISMIPTKIINVYILVCNDQISTKTALKMPQKIIKNTVAGFFIISAVF